MLPNLTLIVAVYVVIRLITLALRQFPAAARKSVVRVSLAVGAAAGVVLVVLCTLDTIGLGLSVGTAIDAHKGGPFKGM